MLMLMSIPLAFLSQNDDAINTNANGNGSDNRTNGTFKDKEKKKGNDFEFQITEACVFLRSIFINKRKIYGAKRVELKLINVYLIVLRN